MDDSGPEEGLSGSGPGSLAIDRRGAGERIDLVHGFTQNQRCWGRVVQDLARDHEIVAIDAPGHGGSGNIDASFEDGAGLIGNVGGEGTYIGYSMGGRYCLRLGIDHPELVRRLVVVGGSPGIAEPTIREQRRIADEALALRAEEIGLIDFLNEWLANPLFAHLQPSQRFIKERLENNVVGLASSLRTAGTGAQEPLWDLLDRLEMPVLIVTGAFDAKFTAIAERMSAAIGDNATHIVIPDAGHTAHLERPDAFLSALRAWLRSNPEPYTA